MQERVKQFLHWDILIADRIQFWVLLGPVFLILSLFLSSFGYPIPNLDLWLIVMASFILCWSYPRLGFVLSFSLLIFSVACKHYFISSHHLWQLGLEISVALGLFITSSSFKRMTHIVKSLDTNRKNLLQNLSLLEGELKKEESLHLEQHSLYQDKIDRLANDVDEKNEELLSLKSLYDSIQKSNENEDFERHKLAQECLETTRRIAFLEDKLSSQGYTEQNLLGENFIKKLTKAQKEQLQSKQIKQSLLNLLTHSQTIEKPSHEKQTVEKKDFDEKYDEIVNLYEKKLNDYQQYEYLYKQLKQQFTNKAAILHQARKDIFSLQEKLLIVQKEKEDQELRDDSYENELIGKIEQLEDELLLIEEENTHLESLISRIQDTQISQEEDQKKKIRFQLEEQDLPF